MKNCIAITDPSQEKTEGAVRVVCISDTHGHGVDSLCNLPEGDILIHAGDFSLLGKDEKDVEQFNDFLSSVKHQYKDIIVIAGNHDILFDECSCNNYSLKRGIARLYFKKPAFKNVNATEMKSLLKNCIYLEDSGTVCQGLKIYGSPWLPPHFDLGFNLKSGALKEKCALIPDDIDVLITHGPPKGILDQIKSGQHVGCPHLADTLKERVQPKLHVFGHIHEAHGVYEGHRTVFANASICDEYYKPIQYPLVFDVMVD